MIKRKLIVGFMTANLLFGITIHAESKLPAYNDIKGSFAEESIIQLTGQGIISGITPEKFAPEQNISRKHFAVLFAKVLGIQPIYPASSTFKDLPKGVVEFGYVEALAKLGLLKGKDNNHLGADDPISRQEVAILIHRVFGEETTVPTLNGRYLDEKQISSYAMDSVAYVSWKELMKGSNGYFLPLQEMTRAEAAVLARRLYDLRIGQAISSDKDFSSQQLEVKVGETLQIEPQNVQGPLYYTPIYGLDNPAIGTISSNGVFTAGQQPGTGTITINVGYSFYNIKISVLTN